MNNFTVSTEKNKLDRVLIHRFLSEQSTWALGISVDLVNKAIDHSLCFGLYKADQQIGFARVITDKATFTHLVDVFVIEAERGKGLSKLLMNAVLAHADLQGLRRFTLTSSTAQWLYEKLGFSPIEARSPFMQRYDPHVYVRDKGDK